MKPQTKIKNGFTLIEVTIVMFIIVLMTSITVPWMKTFAESSRLRSAARGIRNLMEYARVSAITERAEFVVMFDRNNNEYWLSMKALLSETTGGSVTDLSRTSLTESLQTLAENQVSSNTSSNSSSNSSSSTRSSSSSSSSSNNNSESVKVTRTTGILGLPKQLPEGIQIAQINKYQTLVYNNIGGSSSNNLEYVTFYPDSTSEDFEVYLVSPSQKVMLLSITKSTGRTEIRDLKPNEIEQLFGT